MNASRSLQFWFSIDFVLYVIFSALLENKNNNSGDDDGDNVDRNYSREGDHEEQLLGHDEREGAELR